MKNPDRGGKTPGKPRLSLEQKVRLLARRFRAAQRRSEHRKVRRDSRRASETANSAPRRRRVRKSGAGRRAGFNEIFTRRRAIFMRLPREPRATFCPG
jgi:hypothetical protein